MSSPVGTPGRVLYSVEKTALFASNRFQPSTSDSLPAASSKVMVFHWEVRPLALPPLFAVRVFLWSVLLRFSHTG
ncbi:hypothetical protein ACIQWY_12730 [Streptomyces albidoflavus]